MCVHTHMPVCCGYGLGRYLSNGENTFSFCNNEGKDFVLLSYENMSMSVTVFMNNGIFWNFCERMKHLDRLLNDAALNKFSVKYLSYLNNFTKATNHIICSPRTLPLELGKCYLV